MGKGSERKRGKDGESRELEEREEAACLQKIDVTLTYYQKKLEEFESLTAIFIKYLTCAWVLSTN